MSKSKLVDVTFPDVQYNNFHCEDFFKKEKSLSNTSITTLAPINSRLEQKNRKLAKDTHRKHVSNRLCTKDMKKMNSSFCQHNFVSKLDDELSDASIQQKKRILKLINDQYGKVKAEKRKRHSVVKLELLLKAHCRKNDKTKEISHLIAVEKIGYESIYRPVNKNKYRYLPKKFRNSKQILYTRSQLKYVFKTFVTANKQLFNDVLKKTKKDINKPFTIFQMESRLLKIINGFYEYLYLSSRLKKTGHKLRCSKVKLP